MRKRMIDPSIWTNRKFLRLKDVQKLLYIGLFSTADDYGKLWYDLLSIKASIFPCNNIAEDELKSSIEILVKLNLVITDTKVIKIHGWDKHQTIPRPLASSIPDPIENDNENTLHATNNHDVCAEHALNIHDACTVHEPNKHDVCTEHATDEHDDCALHAKERNKERKFKERNKEREKGNFIDEIIDVFSSKYLDLRNLEYRANGKDHSAVGKLLSYYKKNNPESNSIKTLKDFEIFFEQCLRITDKWYYNNMSLPLINSKINEIRIILRQADAISQAIRNAVDRNFRE